MTVENEKVFDIPEISNKDTEWFNTDKSVSLKFVHDTSTEEYGTFTLTLP